MGKTISSHAGPRKRNFLAFGGLFGGFVLGQGSLFLVQTWLLAAGQLATVASLGVAIAVLSLAQWTADWGSLVLLARHALINKEEGAVWAAHCARSLVAIPIACCLTVFALWYANIDSFASGIVLGGVAVAPVWALNISGFLDGLGKSALSGPLASLPWLASSATAFVVLNSSPVSFASGLWIGSAYALGCAMCVSLQHIVYWTLPEFLPPAGIPARSTIMGFLRAGAAYNLAEFPAQLYGRLLIFIVALTLGPQATASYVYIRQILSGIAQTIAFIKRVELIQLSEAVTATPLRILHLLSTQAFSLGASVVVFLIAIAALPFRHWLPQPFPDIIFYIAFFAAALPAWALAASFEHIIIFQDRILPYVAVKLLVIITSGLLVVSFSRSFGLTFIAWVDMIMNLTQALILALIALRKRSVPRKK